MRKSKEFLLIQLVILFCVSQVFGQEVEVNGTSSVAGIHFEQGTDWDQILSKAKAENKYIFVDCYTTWCGPCKKMDVETYRSSILGSYSNPRFLSVKVQMDTSKDDDGDTKGWYAFAHKALQEYEISGYPTLLFFSFDGKILHKVKGYKNVNGLLDVMREAADSNYQYFVLIEKFRKNRLVWQKMMGLAIAARRNGDQVADSVASCYIDHLFTLNNLDLMKRENIQFIGTFKRLMTTNGKAFDLFYHHGDEVDRVMGVKGIADNYVNEVISRELVDPAIHSCEGGVRSPDWDRIEKNVRDRFGDSYAILAILAAKTKWYSDKGNWRRYIPCLIREIDWYEGRGNETLSYIFLNNSAFDIFRHSNHRVELKRGVDLVDHAIRSVSEKEGGSAGLMPVFLDTKANLLYKLGGKRDAIVFERHAISLLKRDSDAGLMTKFSSVLKKMINDEPTWTDDAK
jgi:thioredoxin-related protein